MVRDSRRTGAPGSPKSSGRSNSTRRPLKGYAAEQCRRFPPILGIRTPAQLEELNGLTERPRSRYIVLVEALLRERHGSR